MLCSARNAQPHQAQQRLRNTVGAAGLKRGRVRVFTPDAIKLRQDAVAEDIQKALKRLVPFATLGDVIQVGRW